MVPKLIGTKELESQQYIGQTPQKYVHIDMKMNFMHISSNLRLGGVSPIYWVKERKHAKETTWSKYACSILSRTDTKRRKDTKWINQHLEDINWKIHQGMRYPLIHTKLKMSTRRGRGGMPNKRGEKPPTEKNRHTLQHRKHHRRRMWTPFSMNSSLS